MRQGAVSGLGPGFLLLAVFCGPASAQVGGNPTVAPISGFNPLNPRRISPLLDVPDGLWNFGEGAQGTTSDLGATHGLLTKQQIDTNLVLGNLVQLQGWTVSPGNLSQSWFGRLQRATPQGGDEVEAAIKITVPNPAVLVFPDPNRPRYVLVLGARESIRPDDDAQLPYAPHDYPGRPFAAPHWGLHDAPPFPYPEAVVERHVLDSLMESMPAWQVIGAWGVTRIAHRPLTFSVQRLRELRRAALLRLQADFGINPADVVVLLGGSSYGGLVVQAALIYYPNEFHGGVVSAYSGNHRSVPNEQDALNFAAATLGEQMGGNAYDLRSSLEFTL